MIDKIHDYEQIDSIYIFGINNIKCEHYLKEDHEKYYKLIGIYTEHETLLKVIQENIYYLIKQSQITSLFEQDERTMKNLNSELHDFNAFRVFKYVLLKTNYDEEQEKREMLEICRNYYRGNKKELANINEFEQNYKSTNAIYWYTRPTFIYRLINKALRTEDYESLLIFRFFIIDLCKNLQLKYDDLKQHHEQFVSYHGLNLSPPEIYHLKYNIGKNIATNGFLSTSRSKDIANTFAKKGTKCLGVETVILEIHVDTTKLTTALVDIAEYSDYPEEQEVLFDLGTSFTIDNVTYDENDKIWLVKLSSVSEEVLMNDIQTLLKECRETEMNLLLGELLVRMGYYNKCRKYLENLFNLYENEYEYVAKIYELIGWSYADEKKYDQAILNYEKAFDRYLSFNQWEDASKVTNDIATCYYGKEDKVMARQYFEKAYDILKNKINLPDNHCVFGFIMKGFGILDSDNNSEIARNYYSKALEIYQNVSKTCKCNHHDDKIAQIYENIGLTYRDDGNYIQTIVYFQESEKLRKKYVTLWKERKAYTQCLIVIQGCYIRIKDKIGMNIYENKVTEFMENNLFFETSSEEQKFYLERKTRENLLIYELKLLKLLEKNQPFNYEKIIEQHLNIGKIYTKTKDYKWAREHYDKTYKICETKINSKEKQAQYLFDIGHRLLIDDKGYAFKFVNKALEIRLLILKNDDINIGFSHYAMVACYETMNMFDMAIEHLQKAANIFEKYINDEQEYQFNVKELYTDCYYYSGFNYEKKHESDKAIEYILMAANLKECFFHNTPIHYCTLAKCYRFIAIKYDQMSNYNEAITFYNKYLEKMDKHLEDEFLSLELHNHSNEILRALFSLGTIYTNKKDYNQSIHYYEKFIQSAPIDHNNLPLCYVLIGQCHMDQKYYEKAIENFKKAIVHLENISLNKQNLYAGSMMYMGIGYSELGKNYFDNAIDCTLKAIKIYEQDSRENKTELALCYLIYGDILFKKGQYVESIEIANQSLTFQVETKLNVALTYLLLGCCYYEKDDYQTAFKHTKLSMEIYKEYCPEFNDEHSANIYGVIAKCCFRLNNFDEALSYALKLQEILNKLSSKLNIKKAGSLIVLALIYSKQYQYEKSMEYRKRALDICKQLIIDGENINGIGSIFEDNGELYINENKLKKARKYYKKALKYFKQDLIEDHPKIQRIQSAIDQLSQQYCLL
ncbi:unnamed protein product [Rotaria sordida]|uniref:ADP ribosyltransferase domain-containing protein n=1 Tax=Rotaria sordida TaxID=392033 RepID=A0A819TTE0_9BILA|nr:unnamed protein product [Rotaria sordida]